ncbi:MAG: signal peptidase II [Clostridia bacterium]|nr:signal peptidase II [Clostridia bacterium]
MKKIITLISIICASVLLDQLTKLLVLSFMELGQSIEVIPGVLNITYIQNKGAAFGMLQNHRWVFMVVSTVAIIALGVYLFRFCKERMMMKVGIAVIIGGGIGNMIDRVAYGFVVDMIDFCPFDFWIWIFNVADACVCVGAGVVILSIVLDIVKEVKARKNEN